MSNLTTSAWHEDCEMPAYSPLSHNISADVCVVGAGIAGVSVAYMLSKEGKRVVILDDGTIGGGETGRTTAHLVYALDDRYFELERLHGQQGAKLALESHSAAIDLIERIVDAEKIDCDFERLDGFLFAAPNDVSEKLDRELATLHDLGCKAVEIIPQAPLPFETGPALRFPKQAQFHPLKYLRALAAAFQRNGGTIFTQTHVSKVEDGKEPVVTTDKGFCVRAEAIVVATNVPVNDRVFLHTKQAAYRTYVVGFQIPRDSVKVGLYWDLEDPYHYIRLQRTRQGDPAGYDRLIVGGEDHKTGQPESDFPFLNLEKWARARFAMVGDIDFRWSGQVTEPVDSLAFIGKNPWEENVYICTGDSGNGMTHGTIAGVLITDLILGRPNEWETLYDPKRRTLSTAGTFAKENLNVVAQYGDWIKPSEVKSLDDIPCEKGAVVRHDGGKRAVYRDGQGQLHTCSAVCPHLGGIVRWNDTEKTWDCPCHGSRFDALGKVINGPAIQGLKPCEAE